jgi:hypothetical protein
MANKEDKLGAPNTDDLGNSFEKEDQVLNYKPRIEYEEPEQITEERPISEEPPGLSEIRDRTQNLISGYQSVRKLVALAKKRIDDRVAAGGGMEVKLDPKADAMVISALQRCFPNLTDYTKITYEQYKTCLARLTKMGQMAPQIAQADIDFAKQNPLQTQFGGLINQAGENRPEISSPANMIKPVDTQQLQTAGTLSLFKKMYPLIHREIINEVQRHEVTKKHGI